MNGGPARRARVAMERLDIPGFATHPDAPIAAFEFMADLSELADHERVVSLEAVAHAVDGRRLRLDPVTFFVAPAESGFDDENASELRRRSSVGIPPNRAPTRDEVRLLAVTHMLTYGGGSLFLAELLQRLARRPGLSCELVSLADGPLRQELEDSGIPVHITDGFPVTSVGRYEGHMAELLAWSASRGFNAALVNTLGAFAGADLATRLRIPALWAVHESFPLPLFWHTAYPPGALHPYVRARAEQALRKTAGVIFEAEATRRLFLDDADPDRLVTLPYGIEVDAIDLAHATLRRAETRRRLGIADNARVLLCLGSIEARKAQAMLAQAFAQIAKRHPRAELVLVGETDDAYCAGYRRALHEYVARSGLGGRVRIEPVTGDPYAWHAVADALVCASDVESLPRVIMEAMAFGTPVLSTRVFGVPELIEDGRTGFLCDMRDLADLAAALDRVLSSSAEELAAISEAASARVRERHDPARYAGQVWKLLTGLVAEPNGLPGALLRDPVGKGVPRVASSRRSASSAPG